MRPQNRFARMVGLVTLLTLASGATVAVAEPGESTELARLIAEAGTAEDHDGAVRVVVFDRTESDIEASGLAHVTNHTLVKLLTETGCVQAGTQRFDYDPATQAIEIRAARVHRQGGAVEDVDLSGLVDSEQPASMIYWGARMLTLQMPRLAVGDAVELETYRKGFMIAYLGAATSEEDEQYIPPMRGHWYDVQLFQGSVPMLEKTVTVTTPRDKPLQYRVHNGEVFSETTFDSEHFTYRFWKTDCEPAPSEWRGPARSDVVPKVVMATVDGWPAKSRWFWEANAVQFEDDPEISAVVEEVTRGLKSDEAKVHALNHWAAMNIRYCGLNMGEGEGYTLHPGDMILRERSGVCKDIAGMSITLCRAAGYEVYPAMTMAGSRVEATPADQFNHCVGAWKKPDGTWHMLDPTWIPFSRYDWSRMEGEQHYVIGTPDGEELMAIRPFGPVENAARFTVRGEIEADGTLNAKVTLRVDGAADTRLRRAIGQTPRDRIEPGLRDWLGHLAPGTGLVKWRAGDPLDWEKPMWLEVELRAPGYATVGEHTASWHPVAPSLAFADYGGTVRIASARGHVEEETRETAVMLWMAQTVSLDEEIHAPRGFTPREPASAWQAGGEGDFAACELRAEVDGRTVKLHGSVRYDRRLVPTEAWPAFRAAVESFDEAAQTRLVAERKGS